MGKIMKSQMKICQICSHYNVGGAGKIIHYLHSQLIADNVGSMVVYGRAQNGNDKYVYRIGSTFTNKIDALITRLVGFAGFQSWSATRKLVKILEREKPNIIHFHGLHGYYVNYPILFNYINKNKIPCVWTFHDCCAFTGKCGHPHECVKYMTGCHNCTRLKDYPVTYGLDFTKQMWNWKKNLFTSNRNIAIVTPSDWMHHMVERSFFKNNKIFTINNGIDTNVFKYNDKVQARQLFGLDPIKPVVLSVAYDQSNPNKGLRYVFNAAKTFPQYRFVVVGWNDKVKSSIDLSQFKNVVVRPFEKKQEVLASLYAAADVFLLPSAAENYATTAVEATMCGCPVVAFNVGGNKEIIDDDEKGILVEYGSQEEFNKAIHALCESGKKTDEVRKLLSDKVTKRNSMKRMYQSYFELYQRVLDVNFFV